MNYIDLHTHQLKNSGVFEIKNIFAQDYRINEFNFMYSVGLHPWHIEYENWNDCFQKIIEASVDRNMLFIGECGLDRSIKIAFAMQEECFRQQIYIADKYCKPLIIHCVRAFNDLIRIKKETKSLVPWILHGYSGNLETTLSLIKCGFYFSVGERFLNDGRRHEILKKIPDNLLFFETDESLVPIEELYQKASAIRHKPENELISIVWNNLHTILKSNI